jgi:mannitol-1-phosphate/altronate dehydrogenase
MHFVRRRETAGIVLEDPLADRLARLAREQTTGEATTDVGAFLSLHEMFPRDLAADVRFRKTLERAYGRLAAERATLLT